MILGRHVLIDGVDADTGYLNDKDRLTSLLMSACEATGAVVLSAHGYQFVPQGVTVVVILAESHAAIHTYPEHGRWMADVFTCGNVDPSAAVEVLQDALGGETNVRYLDRG